MNENERKSGETDQGSETVSTKSPSSPKKIVGKPESPLKGMNISKSLKLKNFDTLRVETPLTKLVENSAAEAFTPLNVDDSTLKNTENSKKVEMSTLESNEIQKSVENGTILGFEKSTLKALATRELLALRKLPGNFDKHSLMSSEARLKGDALLKSLLSASTALTQKMITTTEVTDENLNLRKILYQADKAKCDEREFDSPVPNANSANDSQNDEDERRLVIDIPEEMNHRINKKSMPTLESFEDENKNMSKMLRPSTLSTAFVSTRPLMRQPTAAHDSECIPACYVDSVGSTPS